MLSPTSIRDDVNTIWKQKSNAAKKSWIAAHVITRNGGVFELLTVSDMLQIARLSPCVGRTYLQQLLGMPASATAQYLRAARLRNAHKLLCDKLYWKEPRTCKAEIDVWLGGRDKSLGSKPGNRKNCVCSVCYALRWDNGPSPAVVKSHHKQQPEELRLGRGVVKKKAKNGDAALGHGHCDLIERIQDY